MGLLSIIIFAVIGIAAKLYLTDHHASNYAFINSRAWEILDFLFSVKSLFIMLFIIAMQWIYSYFLADSYKIGLRKEGITLKYGVFSTSSELILFTKIQDILINQGVLERILGLSTVIIQDSFGKPEKIPGLGSDVAQKLQDAVLSHINQ
jgi:membrane protein YdbS with pleckstrin-like domain